MEAMEAMCGIVFFWDNRALKLLRMKVGVNSIPYHFKSLRIILWVFTKLYRPL